MERFFDRRTNGMSIPIPICRFRKALESEEALVALKSDLQKNMNFGAMSICECPHIPPCKALTDEEWTELERKIE
jgi:hypothetical protein